MPEKLKPMGKPNFSSLNPAEVRVSNVVEIGAKFRGRLPEWVMEGCQSCQKCEGCESCQKCEGCQSCQKSLPAFPLEKEIGVENLGTGPVKVAKDVIYELVQEADMEHGECVTTQSRVILEMPEKTFENMPGKDRYIEIGTTKAGTKQYLLKETSPKRTK